MSPKNPLTYGFRAIPRDPALIFVEILWRWCFGAMTFAILFGATLRLLGSVTISQSDASALRSHDPLLMAQSLWHTLLGLASEHGNATALVLLAVTILWIALGATGRTLTLNRLSGGGARLRSIVALHCLRALFLWLAVIALVKALAWDARVAGRGGTSDVFLYSALSVWSAILIGALWLVANWHLSLAASCCAKHAGGFARGIRQALGLVRSHAADLAGVSLVFAVLRLIVVALTFVLWMLPSRMIATSPQVYFAWVVLVTLGYCVAADFVYISRMAAYLAVDTLDPDDRPIRPSLRRLSGN
jgi:hypothetical protein